jgi:hypothetical protein
MVTSAEAFPIGVFASEERGIVDSIQAITRLSNSTIEGPMWVVLIALLCVVLFAIQYLLSRMAALFSYNLELDGNKATPV